ncbi:MerR family transcriptional regulator [Nonomuraea endophytica]|uniref:DNA-binding transcriptional MerR regulator n=1 Tax=Nonomuraea endophytica TaxID=714136 RepID=A0A7W8EIH5_9ACTN|nr:MerR family transcriptional regulator [Nonomuraea endophytica]MBB5080558.1 DNA-binding transcriptional MerR regulator [Nonomuraea endophytica]
MRISELSAESGVALPTVKYYLREGLLHPGEQRSATRADYDDTHLRRLRLIRALLEVGKLPVASIKKIIEAVDDESLPVHTMLGTAHYALAPEVAPAEPGDELEAARAEVDRVVAGHGWQVLPDAPPRAELAEILLRMRSLGMTPDLAPYAEAADRLVREVEMATIPFDGPRDAAVEALVLGTVLYGKAFDALRRLAQESESARRLAR